MVSGSHGRLVTYLTCLFLSTSMRTFHVDLFLLSTNRRCIHVAVRISHTRVKFGRHASQRTMSALRSVSKDKATSGTMNLITSLVLLATTIHGNSVKFAYARKNRPRRFVNWLVRDVSFTVKEEFGYREGQRRIFRTLLDL
jgi:hypothetical protein